MLGAIAAWGFGFQAARARARSGAPLETVVAGGAAGVAVALLLLVATAVLRLPDATDDRRLRWAEVPASAIVVLSLAVDGAGKLASLRDARVGAWLVAAGLAGIGLAALAYPRRSWFSWVWLAGGLGGAAWVLSRGGAG